MRVQSIAFVPPAALVTGLLFFLTSSLVSAIEGAFVPPSPDAPGTAVHEIVRHETECEALRRRIEEVAQDANTCERHAGCLGSPLLCPIVMAEGLELEYERLRSAVLERCIDVPTYAMPASSSICGEGDADCAAAVCHLSEEWSEPVTGATTPGVFVF